MAFQEFVDGIRRLFGRRDSDDSTRPDGGTNFYRPVRKKKESAQEEPAAAGNGGVSYIHTGFTGMNPPTEGMDPMASGMYTGTGMNPPRDNISYMPGVMPQTPAPSYAHVEHIMAMTSLKSCYEAIECMKNGETLIITLDAIANEGESMRCQDMLAGAAFTLGCTVRMLQGGKLVLIAPENVKILPEQPEGRAEMGGAPYTQYVPPVAEEPAYVGRRERRVSQRSAQWTAARNGEMNGYNPYTGTMPAAAGDYERFGGYGY